jgi:two-component system NarL family sensor kinase
VAAEHSVGPVSAGSAAPVMVRGADRTPGDRRFAGLAAGLAAATAIEVLLAAGLSVQQGLSLAYLLEGHEVSATVVGVAFGSVGTAVVWRQPRHRLGWLFVLVSQLLCLSEVGARYGSVKPSLPLSGLAAYAGNVLWVPAMGIGVGLLTLLFPDGRPQPRMRPAVWIVAAACTAGSAAYMLAEIGPAYRAGGRSAVSSSLLIIAGGCLFICLGGGLAGAVGLALKLRRVVGPDRVKIAWFFAAFLLAVLTSVLPVPSVVQLAGVASVPIALGAAMYQEGLYSADRALSRALVHVLLTVLLTALIGGVVGLAAYGFGGADIATFAVAVALAIGLLPAHTIVERGVDRFLYGPPRGPYAMLTQLENRVAGADDVDAMLPDIAKLVVEGVGLGSVRMYLGTDPVPAATHGHPSSAETVLELRRGEEHIGQVIVTPLPGSQLDVHQHRLLADLAAPLTSAAHAARLTHQLRRSRDELARIADTERHRMRRDLHDGLGPALAGLSLGLQAALDSARGTSVEPLLSRLDQEMRATTDDVRRLTASIPPTDLDMYGLVEAVRRRARSLSDRRLRIDTHICAELPALPPDVELAAYRIITEALTNTARHAGANRCLVTIAPSDERLEITVTDDGQGLPSTLTWGLGMHSMQERTTELGGSFHLGAPPTTSGTLIHASLPFRAAT